MAAQEQRFRLEREAAQREIEARERAKNEREGARVRKDVLDRAAKAKQDRSADVAEAALELKTHDQAVHDANLVLKSQGQKERQRIANEMKRQQDDETAHAKFMKVRLPARPCFLFARGDGPCAPVCSRPLRVPASR